MASVPAVSRAETVRAHLRVPLFRDGYALVANEGLTAALGLVYWLIAAREYAPSVVGTNTAAISAMMFIAGVAQLNLMSALLRFVELERARMAQRHGDDELRDPCRLLAVDDARDANVRRELGREQLLDPGRDRAHPAHPRQPGRQAGRHLYDLTRRACR